MKKHLILMVLVLAALTQSCKKAGCYNNEEVSISFDTVPMHPYFPAYPGSFWEYDDGSMTVVEEYNFKKLNKSHMKYDTCLFEYNSVQPVINYSNEHFLLGNRFYSKDNQSQFGAHFFHSEVIDTILGKTLLSKYVDYGGNGSSSAGISSYTEKVIEILPSLTIQDTTYLNVVKTEYIHYHGGGYYGSLIIQKTHKYYAKDVGLIALEDIENQLYGTGRKELVNFYINN